MFGGIHMTTDRQGMEAAARNGHLPPRPFVACECGYNPNPSRDPALNSMEQMTSMMENEA